jgi:hypothetical protein
MTEKQDIPWLRKSQIHKLLKALSPKRIVNSSWKGQRSIPRSITPQAQDIITDYLNHHVEMIIKACEKALKEVNENPNSYYLQHRYDKRVIEKALKKIKK